MRKLRIAVVEDDRFTRLELVRLLELHRTDVQIVGQGGNVDDVVRIIKEIKPEVLISDIQIPDRNRTVFNAFEQLKDEGVDLSTFVFTAISSVPNVEYYAELFKLRAFRFLPKPILAEDVVGFVQEVKTFVSGRLPANFSSNRENSTSKVFKRRKNNETLIIDLDSILYFKGDGENSILFTKGEGQRGIAIVGGLKTMETNMPSHLFCRIRKSELVNLANVKLVQEGSIHFFHDIHLKPWITCSDKIVSKVKKELKDFHS